MFIIDTNKMTTNEAEAEFQIILINIESRKTPTELMEEERKAMLDYGGWEKSYLEAEELFYLKFGREYDSFTHKEFKNQPYKLTPNFFTGY